MRTSEPVHELFLNYACTAKCPFCYNPPLTPELLSRDLTYPQAAASLYAAAQSGSRALNLHGGEVTLRDDLPKILRLARKLGFGRITLVTNGVRLGDRSYCRALLEAGATHVRLSLHGPDAAAHDPIVAIPGAFDRAVAALGHLRELSAPVGLNFVLIRANLASLPAFLERFCLGLGVDDVIVYFPHLRGMMAVNAAAEGLTYGEAAPHVGRGAALLARAGRLESLWLANFVPCVLPGLSGRMLDWSRATGEAAQTHPEGFREDIREMKDGQRAPVAACASCALAAECLGVEREYVARYGEAGFAGLAAAAGARP